MGQIRTCVGQNLLVVEIPAPLSFWVNVWTFSKKVAGSHHLFMVPSPVLWLPSQVFIGWLYHDCCLKLRDSYIIRLLGGWIILYPNSWDLDASSPQVLKSQFLPHSSPFSFENPTKKSKFSFLNFTWKFTCSLINSAFPCISRIFGELQPHCCATKKKWGHRDERRPESGARSVDQGARSRTRRRGSGKDW